MFICNDCKSTRIKTRTNKSFGKSKTTAVSCKDCGSTNIGEQDERRYGRRRRR